MNSLLSYGSDDSGDEGYTMEPRGPPSRNNRKPIGSNQDDTNYDEVQMSLSEDSDSEPNGKKSKEDRRPSRDRDVNGARDSRRDSRDDRYSRTDDRSSREDDRHTRDDERSKHRDRDDKDDNRNRNRDEDKHKDRYGGDREDDRGRRDDKRARSRDRDRNSRDDRYSRDRRDRDRRRSRSRSRDRRRSRSPNKRSRSRERTTGRGGYYKKFDRSNRDRFDNRNNSKPDSATQINVGENQPKDRFFMPGITGRFRDQIEKRKLLWQKGKETEKVEPTPVVAIPASTSSSSKTTKVWETTTFAQDSDGKVANKFKRLMGIKTPTDANKVTTEVLKKQEEMFTSMEAQYEVARTATHTMRGVGLGFGSYQR